MESIIKLICSFTIFPTTIQHQSSNVILSLNRIRVHLSSDHVMVKCQPLHFWDDHKKATLLNLTCSNMNGWQKILMTFKKFIPGISIKALDHSLFIRYTNVTVYTNVTKLLCHPIPHIKHKFSHKRVVFHQNTDLNYQIFWHSDINYQISIQC